MRETEQRVTALLNDEIQIAQFIPPHLRQRVEKTPKLRIAPIDSVEIMFLAMQPKPPFDKKEVRQAVCHAINRDQIIGTILEGFASRLDGPIGPGQYGYDPNLKPKMNYDPETVEKTSDSSRLSQRRRRRAPDSGGTLHSGQAVDRSDDPDAQRRRVFAPELLTPEWPTLWANVQKGTFRFIIWAEARCRIQAPHCTNTFILGDTAYRLFQSQVGRVCWIRSRRSSIRKNGDNTFRRP